MEDLRTKQIIFDKIFNTTHKGATQFTFEDLKVDNISLLRNTLKKN